MENAVDNMKKEFKKYLLLFGRSLLFWTLAMVVFSTVRYFGVYEEPGINVTFDYDHEFGRLLPYGIYMGILFGIFYSMVEYIVDRFVFSRVSIWIYYLIETLLFGVVIAIAMTITLNLYDAQNATNFVTAHQWWVGSKFYWSILLYVIYISSSLFIIKVASERLGGRVFRRILTGQYRVPQESKHIFMFLDLKSSTSIAEKLGYFMYSQFIQDCFMDLDAVVDEYHASIYQYVGDEVVLIWPFNKGLQQAQCIALFYGFKALLKRRKPYYLKKYGLVPHFKAGVHGGILMVAEVGTIKKEIAYHGDVINTAARIQAQCNVFQQELIVSKDIIDQIDLPADISSSDLGALPLKGKKEKVTLFALESASTS